MSRQLVFRDEQGARPAILQVAGPDQVDITLDDRSHLVERRGLDWWIDGQKAPGRVIRQGAVVHVFAGGAFRFEAVDPLAWEAAAGPEADLTLSPMPGLVKALYVAPGARVRAGDRLALLEAMKMTAARDGPVAEVQAEAGQQVEAGAALMRLAGIAVEGAA